MAKTDKLHIETDKDTYQVGDGITIQVRNENGNPVEDVTVQTSTGIADKTDKTGKTKITFQKTGNIILRANKQHTQNINYVSASKNIQVIEKTIKLHIETDKDTYQVGDNITVQVRDESGNPVKGTTVEATGGIATTDSNGETVITIQQTGDIELEAHKPDTENIDYIADRMAVTVKSP